MKKGFWNHFLRHHLLLAGVLILSSIWFVSCKDLLDEYPYDDYEPEWLGASIYDYLKDTAGYSYYAQLIEDVDYTSVLSKTGSKTLFVANDTAFDRFFKNNEWGVSSYEDLSKTQKKMILNFAMINNAFLIETFANYFDGASLQSGKALRRQTAISVLDTIPFESGNELPKNSFWDSYRSKGLYVLKDATTWPIVHFLQKSLDNAGINDDDFSLITGVEREFNDAHIYNIKVIKRDITCKNGYIHVLEDVLIPPVNIAQHIHKNTNTQTFAGLLERFCAPYYNAEQTEAYNEINLDNMIDSIFELKFFSVNGGKTTYPNGEDINDELLLPYDPGYNLLGNWADFGAILCPTDAAMESYFNSGSGSVLKERYSTWDNVPDDIVKLLIERHMRTSFLESVPSQFSKMNDSYNSKIPITSADISNTYVGVNGVVYETEAVYPPDDYVSVYGPVLFSEKAKVFNWVILNEDFRLYLNSLVSRYSLFVPTDDFFENYIDPLAYAKDVKVVLKYWYNTEESAVNATVYNYDALTGIVGDSVDVIEDKDFLANRLLDILDSHIVIGDVESGSQYYFTKNGNALKVEGSGTSLTVQGGYDIDQGVSASVVPNGLFNQENGNVYFIDKPIQTPLNSVYKILSETPEFSEFFSLLVNFIGDDTPDIFVKKTNYYGIDYNIKFFNTFNYTVYVPTNEAIQQAVADNLFLDWAQIDTIADDLQKQTEIIKLERFLRYHFQDNSVYIGGNSVNALYQTATIKTDTLETNFGTYKDKYYRLGINGGGSGLTLSTEDYGTASVIIDNGLYNIMTRDHVFSNNPQAYEEADGTGTGFSFDDSRITTASTAVIHQIDNVLRFE